MAKQKNLIIGVLVVLFVILFSAITYPKEAATKTIVINPGHSIDAYTGTVYDSGAVSGGVYEATLNYQLAAKLANQLALQGYNVYTTHPVIGWSGKSLLTAEQASGLDNLGPAANSVNPDLAISIHHNSGSASATGFEIYWSSYRANQSQEDGVYTASGLWSGSDAYLDSTPCDDAKNSKIFAGYVQQELSTLSIAYRKTVERDDYFPAHVDAPCILLEAGFVTNATDRALNSNATYQESEATQLTAAINDYFGADQPVADDTAPTGESVTCDVSSPTTDAVFTVRATGVEDAESDVSKVQFAVWSAEGDQDDLIWYSGTEVADGEWEATIDTADHGNDIGHYYVHCYATNGADILGFIGNTDFENTQISVSDGLSCVQLSDDMFKVYAKGYSDDYELQLPVWTTNNDQDDLIWYSTTRQTDGSYAALVDLKDHNNESGPYAIHLYGKDASNKQTFLSNMEYTCGESHYFTFDQLVINQTGDQTYTVTGDNIQSADGINYLMARIYNQKTPSDDIWQVLSMTDNGFSFSLEHDNAVDIGVVEIYGIDENGYQNCLRVLETDQLGSDTADSEENNDTAVQETIDTYTTDTTIMGATCRTAAQMEALYTQNATFPSYYESRGVNLDTFVNMYVEEANAEGVRAEVAFSQMLIETGYLRYGGQVDISQFNFAGIGATDGGAGGADFATDYGDNATGIRMGIRAQIQHLKAYASTEALNNACVDPRFSLVTRNKAPKIGDLGNGNWATDSDYASKILARLNAL